MSIELEQTLKLRTNHLEKGNPPCDHIYEKEFFNGIFTGDYTCKKCGASIPESTYINLSGEKNH
ncbi:hypothetical protein AB1I62_08730 [Enterococcus sp. AN402]|uniref:hypothetical protein n=1 Tax=Enterococcus sp. AN402 TaxID=3151386 RepID=UPI0034588B83